MEILCMGFLKKIKDTAKKGHDKAKSD